MKKKLITLILALVCAIACAFGLAACGDDSNEMTWLFVAKSGEQPDGPAIRYDLTYGQTPDLSDWKLYGYYRKGDVRELSLTDEKLSIKYTAQTGFDTERKEITQLPTVWIRGGYTIEYVYGGDSNKKATVDISVELAESADFTIQPLGGTTWQSQGEIHKVIVKNPQNAVVTRTSYNDLAKTDDTDGEYFFYLFQKSAYDGFTQEQKRDHAYLNQYSSENNYDKVFAYYPEETDVVGVPAGEYMLVALIGRTCNYINSVSSAVQITVTAPSGQ